MTSTSRLGVSVRYPRKESSWSFTVNGSEWDASWCSCVVSAAVWIVRASGANDWTVKRHLHWLFLVAKRHLRRGGGRRYGGEREWPWWWGREEEREEVGRAEVRRGR